MSAISNRANRANRARRTGSAPRKPGIWVIAGQLGRRQYWLFAALGLLTPLALWAALAASSLIDPVFLPSPAMVARRIVTWLTEDDLLADTGISIYRVTAGFVLSAVLALPLGLLIGSFRPVAAMLEPLTDFIRYMPAVAFIPLVMLWVGIDEGAKVAIIFIGTFFQMVLIIANTTRLLDRSLLEAAQTLGASHRQLVRNVILPGVLPNLYNDLRILLGWAWTYLIVAELIGAKSGITAYIAQQSRYFNFDLVYAAILVIGLIGLATDQALQFAGRFLFPWQRRATSPLALAIWNGIAFLPRRVTGAARALLSTRMGSKGGFDAVTS
jgi:NitT/TauT family transport system permease protein